MTECAVCGAGNPEGFKFCGACGASLATAPPASEERKVVTTLFCDLVDFTSLGEVADPEDVAALLRRYHAEVRHVIRSHGGTVEKFIGDAVVGVFGVPATHEDDAERGVRAGLRIVQAVRDAGLARPGGGPVQVRVGVATGEALVRLDVEPASGCGFLTGDAVNTAARLQAAAPPMGVVAGALTHELTHDAIDYEALPPVVAKGKAEPVVVWRARRARAHTGLRTSSSTGLPFLGRDEELQALDRELRIASEEGSARFVLIVGEPGIGKSRLVLEFARSLDARPQLTTWRMGRCLPYGDGVAFWALGEIVKAHAGILDSDDAGSVEAKLEQALAGVEDAPWLSRRLRPLLGLEAPRAERSENFTAWTRFLELVASARPAVLVLEDLHWAGDGMLAFLDHLLARKIDVPLLVVATARPELLERQAGVLVTAGDTVRRITLPALSARHAGSLVTHLLDAGSPVDIREQVVAAAGGNPLYAEQYARLLLETGLSGGTGEDVTSVLPGNGLPLPETLHAVLSARIDTVPPDQKALLADAAVLGETFWRGGVSALSGRDTAEVDAVMAALCARDLIRPVASSSVKDEPEYLFWHALTRDVAYAQLPRRARALKHAAAAAWVSGCAGAGSDELTEIAAHHATVALDLARAVGDEELAASLLPLAIDALRRSGERGLRLDIAAAERQVGLALKLADGDSSARAELLSLWARILLLTNRCREAVPVFDEAVEGLRSAGKLRAAALALCWSADALSYLNEPALHRARAAVELLRDDGPSPELVEVLGHYALGLTIHDEDPRLVIAFADRAISASDLLGLPDPVVALSTRGSARITLGDTGGWEDIRRAEEAAESQGLGIERSTTIINHSSLTFLTDGAEAEQAAVAVGLAFVTGHGLAVHSGAFESALTHCAYKLGEWDQVLERIEAALPALMRLEDEWDLLFVRSLQALVLTARGRPEAVESVADWLVDRGRVSEIGWARGFALMSAAVVRTALGETGEAAGVLGDCFVEPQATMAMLDAAPEAARAMLGASCPALAARLVGVLERLAASQGWPLTRHVLVTCRSLLQEAEGDCTEAAGGFARAAEGWRDFSMPYEEAQALLGQGRCLIRLGRGPEVLRGLGRAASIFERLGARPALAEAAGLMSAVPCVD